MEKKHSNKDEIDLIIILSVLWNERKYVLYSCIFFLILGITIAVTSKEEFISEVRLIPESSQQGGVGDFSGLARQFGIGNLSRSSEDPISSRYYPEIIQSIPVIQTLMEQEIFVRETGDSKSLFDYFIENHSERNFFTIIKKYTIRLPSTIKSSFKNQSKFIINNELAEIKDDSEDNRIIDLNGKEWNVIRKLQSRISVIMDRETGIVIISVKMPEPYVAADVADKVTTLLADYIEDYRTEKSRNDMEFIKDRHSEAEQRFENAQSLLARFRDENIGQLTELAKTREQRLISEFDLAFNIYNALSNRLEEAKIKVQEAKPVIKILDPPTIPNSSSEPNRGLIIIGYLFLGGIIGLAIIFIKVIMRKIRNQFY